MLPLLLDPVCFYWLLGTYEGEPVTFDPWQVAWLRDHSRYRAVEKAPQIGWSWCCALEALHECLMFMDATSGFVSVNQSEAGEKVLYARKAYSELPRLLQEMLPLAKDSTDELWIGDTRRPSRLMSIPATSALRGRRMSVYLDEADFYKDGGRDAFRVAMGRVARGGRVSIGSTCFGEGTQLDLVMQRAAEVEQASNFSISRLPVSVVVNPEVLLPMRIAMAELDEADAAEEYNLVRGGSVSDSFPAELLRRQSHEFEVFDGDTESLREMWNPLGPAVLGVDVGKSRHPTVFNGIEFHGDRWVQTLLHAPRNPHGDPLTLPEQQALLQHLLRRLELLVVVVDGNGIGAQQAQALEGEFGGRAITVIPGSTQGAALQGLPSQTKSEMATELKRGLEADELALMPNREQARQYRQTRLRAGGVVEQKGSRKREHYDVFWSGAYAWYGTRVGSAVTSVYEQRDLVVVEG